MSTDLHGDGFDDLYRSIGRRITHARKARNLTQADLGIAIGHSRSSVANIEAGRQRPGLHIFMLIATHLQIGVAELLGLDSSSGSGMLPVLDDALVAQIRRAAHAEGWHDRAKAERVATSSIKYPGSLDA